MYKVYGWNDLRFLTPLVYIEAESLVTEHEINGGYTLTAEINSTESAKANVKANNVIIADGEPFRITKTENTDTTIKVAANHLFFDLQKVVKTAVEEEIDISVQEWLEGVFASDNTSNIGLLDSNAIESLGLVPMDENFDYNTDTEAMSKKTFYDCIKYIIDNVNQGEIYIGGNTCAVVEEVKTDNVVRTLRLDRELDSIKVTEDTSDIVTRAYVFGKDGLDLTATGRAHPYITSENANIYGVKSGVFDYSNVSDENMLLARANWLFDDNNQNRVDVPYVSIECDYTDLRALGNNVDDIHLGNHYLIEIDGTEYERRVVKISKDLVRPENTKITLGRVQKDLFYYFKRFNLAASSYMASSKSLTANATLYNQVIEVAHWESIAADTANLSAVFADDIFTEYLETNLKPYLLKPNLELDANGNPQWVGNTKSWVFANGTPSSSIRNYLRLYQNKQQFVEEHISIQQSYAENELRALTINGRQVYWSGILGNSQAYMYLTFVSPGERIVNITADNAAMFPVYLPPLTSNNDVYVKAEFSWNYNSTYQTYEPRLTFGAGDGSGNGKYYFEKDSNCGRFVYTSRTNNGKLNGVGLRDDGSYLVKGDFESEIPPIILVTDLDDVPSDAPTLSIIGVYTDTSGGGS